MYSNKEFMRQVGKRKDYHYIRMHGQQNIKIKKKMLAKEFHNGT